MKKCSTLLSMFITLIIAVVIVVASTTPPTGTLIEAHEGIASSSYLGSYQGFQLKQGQEFYLDNEDPQPVTGVGIFLNSTDYGSPSGEVTITIYENSSGHLPGTLVPGSVQSFVPELGQWNYVSFTSPGITFKTAKENKYWIIVKVPEQTGENDAYKWQRSTSNTYDRGYRKTFNMGGRSAWETQSGDFAFRIYGDPTLLVDTSDKDSAIPKECHLSFNYPNPFNPSTRIRYGIPIGKGYHRVAILIYDVIGNKIKTLVDKIHPPGVFSIVWDGCDNQGEDVSSGVYFYKLTLDGKTVAMKTMLKIQ